MQQVSFALDETFSSELLSSKIQDIPQKKKFFKIAQPLFNLFQFEYDYESIAENLIIRHDYLDLIRDRKYIIDEMVRHYGNNQPYNWYIVVEKLKLWDQREFVLQMVIKSGYMLENVKNEQLLNDREIILESVKGVGRNYKLANERFRKDKEITLIAVKEDPMNIIHVADELKNDKEVVKTALISGGFVYQYISEELKNDEEFIGSVFDYNQDRINYIKMYN